MKFRSTLTTQTDIDAAVREIGEKMQGFRPDLLILFCTHHFAPDYGRLLAGIREKTSPRNLIGCTAESVIGPDREVERSPAIAVWGAQLPDVHVFPFAVDQADLERLEGEKDWEEQLGTTSDDRPVFLLLPDPYTLDVESLLRRIDGHFPASPVAGGVASGAYTAGQNRLFLNDQVLMQGSVGVSVSGPVKVRTVVSQGCRPIGRPHVVTRAEKNVIFELGGEPALHVLKKEFDRASIAEKELMQKGVHVGRVVDETRSEFGRGDFLIRNLMGVAEETALVVTDIIKPGRTIQFHVRDAASADEEMNSLLSAGLKPLGSPAGGLLFSCSGRGSRFFDAPDHDITAVNSVTQGVPVAGFFAQGEIGQVAGRTFLHGFTSSLIFFEPETPDTVR